MFWVPKTIETLAIQRMEGNMVEGFVKGSGNQYPELLLFGEAPGENEVIHGIPFIGRAGEMYRYIRECRTSASTRQRQKNN